MPRGVVYVLSNPDMPGLVKVGYTTGSAQDRARDLFKTGNARPHVVEGSFPAEEAHKAERRAHRALASYRATDTREWFHCEPSVALSAVRKATDAKAMPVPGQALCFLGWLAWRLVKWSVLVVLLIPAMLLGYNLLAGGDE